MAKFITIRTERGGQTLLNSDDISSMQKSDRGGTTIIMRDGKTFWYSIDDYSDLVKALGA